MVSKSILAVLFVGLSWATAFTSPPTASTRAMTPASARSSSNSQLNVYVPDGLTAQEYQKIKEREGMKNSGKNLGALGPRGFKSRSMEAWHQAYEKGFTGHHFAPIGYKDKLQKGGLQRQDVPYMVRGGSWDNSDVRGAKKQRWLQTDRDYARGGYKKEQSASLLGSGPGLDWAGNRPRDVNLGNKRVPGFS
jgi:hypothetical protein